MAQGNGTPIPQACAVPFRTCDKGRLEFCLITSVKRGRWGFPKGIIDPGETPAETALKEALEEAGLHGEIVSNTLGSYQDEKWGSVLMVSAMLMQVTGCDDKWDESDVRERCWVKYEQAQKLLWRPEQRELLEVAVKRLGAR